MHIKFNGTETPAFRFDQTGHQPVTCISPFPRQPTAMLSYHELWLDTNILSQVPAGSPNPNIAALVDEALKRKFGMNPILALAEYNRGHDPLTAMEIMLARVPRMEEIYGFLFDMMAVTQQSAQLPQYIDRDRAYVKTLSDLFIIVKYFYCKKDWGFKRRFETFAKIVNRHLPCINIINMIACLYFFARGERSRFPSGFDKIQEAMHVYPDAAENRKFADNWASDLAIFTQTTAYPLTRDPVRFRVPYIATSDEGLALLLREIAYFAVDIEGKLGHGYPGFRSGGVMAAHCPPSANAIVRKYLMDVPEETERKAKLEAMSEEILAGNFEYQEYLS